MSLSSITFVPTQRGGTALIFDGYRYNKVRCNNDKNVTYWRCSKNRNCPGRAVTVDDRVKKTNNKHNHPPEAALPHHHGAHHHNPFLNMAAAAAAAQHAAAQMRALHHHHQLNNHRNPNIHTHTQQTTSGLHLANNHNGSQLNQALPLSHHNQQLSNLIGNQLAAVAAAAASNNPHHAAALAAAAAAANSSPNTSASHHLAALLHHHHHHNHHQQHRQSAPSTPLDPTSALVHQHLPPHLQEQLAIALAAQQQASQQQQVAAALQQQQNHNQQQQSQQQQLFAAAASAVAAAAGNGSNAIQQQQQNLKSIAAALAASNQLHLGTNSNSDHNSPVSHGRQSRSPPPPPQLVGRDLRHTGERKPSTLSFEDVKPLIDSSSPNMRTSRQRQLQLSEPPSRPNSVPNTQTEPQHHTGQSSACSSSSRLHEEEEEGDLVGNRPVLAERRDSPASASPAPSSGAASIATSTTVSQLQQPKVELHPQNAARPTNTPDQPRDAITTSAERAQLQDLQFSSLVLGQTNQQQTQPSGAFNDSMQAQIALLRLLGLTHPLQWS